MKKLALCILLASLILLSSCQSGSDDDTSLSLYDSWVFLLPPDPVSKVVVFDADGSCAHYDDYAERFLISSGSFVVDGSSIEMDWGDGPETSQLTMKSADEFVLVGADGDVLNLYRKSKHPLVTLEATPIATDGTWTTVDLDIDRNFYSFDAVEGTIYRVEWDGSGGSGTYHGSVEVDAYVSDFSSYYFRDEEDGYDADAQEFTAAETGKIYVFVESHSEGEKVLLKVTSP